MYWRDKLPENLHDELEDVIKYSDFAKQAKEGVLKQMFHDMAKEEMEHACAIWYMMEWEGMTDGLHKDHVFDEARAALDENH
jgi:rubrerythrin